MRHTGVYISSLGGHPRQKAKFIIVSNGYNASLCGCICRAIQFVYNDEPTVISLYILAQYPDTTRF